MANERDDKKFGETQGSGSKGQQSETGRQDEQAKDLGEQPAASGGQGAATGQASSGQAQPSGGTDSMTADRNADEGGSRGSDPTGEGFVGSQGKDSSDYLQEKDKADANIEARSEEPPLDGE